MAPKHKSSDDAGSASKPKRSCAVLSISEKLKILDMIQIEKQNCIQRLPDSVARTNLPFAKWWKTQKKKKIHAGFSIALHTAKFTAVAHDKMLMKVEKAYVSEWKIWIEREYPLTATCYG